MAPSDNEAHRSTGGACAPLPMLVAASELDPPAGREHLDGDLGRKPAGVPGEGSGGRIRIPDPGRQRGSEGSPVDRDCDNRLEQCGGPRRALGIHVAAADACAPTPDREQRERDAPSEFAHLLEHVGIAREVDACRPLHEVAERLVPPAERMPAATVPCLRREDPELVDPGSFADLERAGVQPASAQQSDAVAWSEHGAGARQPSEGGEVQMIVVGVGDEHGVESLEPGVERWRNDAPQVSHAGSQHRVGQQPRVPRLDQDGGVPDPGESADGQAATSTMKMA